MLDKKKLEDNQNCNWTTASPSGQPNSKTLYNLHNTEQLQDLLNSSNLAAAPIDLILPAMDKPIDDIITQGYQRSSIAQAMIAALEDPHLKTWPTTIRKKLRVPMVDCKLVGRRIYYRDRLFAPPDDELRTQILYRAHSTGPAGHPGRIKTLNLISHVRALHRMFAQMYRLV